MLDRLPHPLPWAGRLPRVDVGAAQADVLMQSSLVLRGLGAAISRLDLDSGTLEARLAVGGVLRLRAEADDDRSRVAIDVQGRDCDGVARRLARELVQGGGA